MRGAWISSIILLSAFSLSNTGCEHTAPARVVAPPGCDPTYSQYHLDTFQWSNVARVLVLPFSNESPYTRADEEIGEAFRAELQQLGRFEVVAAPADEIARLSTKIHGSGRYNEATLLNVGRSFNADVVIHGSITEYSPYNRPRIGIVLQALAPADARVVASVDGLWDANNLPIAKRAQNYYMQRKKDRGPYLEANWIWPDDGHADELALMSPRLFQRWVCSELAAILVQDPALAGLIFAPRGTKAQTPAHLQTDPGDFADPAGQPNAKPQSGNAPPAKMPRADPELKPSAGLVSPRKKE